MARKILLISVPECFGANRDECGLSPEMIRRAGLPGMFQRMGIAVSEKQGITSSLKPDRNEEIKNIGRILDVSRKLCSTSLLALRSGETPVVLGGDHSISIGSEAALSISTAGKCGVIYYDAHADFNTPGTSPSGNFHGMSLAFACGVFGIKGYRPVHEGLGSAVVDPRSVSIIGARSIDTSEGALLKSSGVSVFTVEDIDTYGIDYVTKKALKASASGGKRVHVSIDMDVLDPAFAPAVSTPVVGGITLRELKLSLKAIKESESMKSIDVAEINPKAGDPCTTINSAIEAILTAFGKDSSASLL